MTIHIDSVRAKFRTFPHNGPRCVPMELSPENPQTGVGAHHRIHSDSEPASTPAPNPATGLAYTRHRDGIGAMGSPAGVSDARCATCCNRVEEVALPTYSSLKTLASPRAKVFTTDCFRTDGLRSNPAKCGKLSSPACLEGTYVAVSDECQRFY